MNIFVQNEAVQTLTALGLNVSQAKVYLALVQNGLSTAKKVSKISGVNRQEIYRIMPKLQRRGLVEKIISSPISWIATPIQDGIAYLIDQREKETSKIRKATTKMINDFKNKESMGLHKEECKFVLIPSQKSIVRWIMNAIDNSQTSNDAIGTLKTFNEMLFSIGEIFENAIKRGIKFRLIMYNVENKNVTLNINQALVERPNFQIRYFAGVPQVSLSIHDNKIALLATLAKDPNSAPSLFSDHPAFIKIISNYFETKWKTAHKYK